MDTTYKRQSNILRQALYNALNVMSPGQVVHNSVQCARNKEIVRVSISNSNSHSHSTTDFAVRSDANIWVFGTGKAAPRMAVALEEILGDSIKDGIVISHDISQTQTNIVQQFKGDHPLPTSESIAATYELVELAQKTRPGDLVLFCVTGGSSALLALPGGDLGLEDLRQTHHLLLNSGAGIHEINTVRKHLSAVKGGQLLPYFQGCQLLNLIISDVPGDNPAFIGSGSTVFDDTTYKDAQAILTERGIWGDLSSHVQNHILAGIKGMKPETVKADDSSYVNPSTFLLGTARKLADTVAKNLEEQQINTWILEESYDEPIGAISKRISRDAISVLKQDRPVKKPAALIYYGESMVHVTGSGLGGRNQHMALSMALSIEGQHHISLLSVGTDGRDGPTDSAGALVNASTILTARENGLDPEAYLKNDDSYHFFEKTGDHIKMGATGNNLMDLQVVLVE